MITTKDSPPKKGLCSLPGTLTIEDMMPHHYFINLGGVLRLKKDSILVYVRWKNHSIFKNFCTASPNKHHGPKPMHPSSSSSSRAFQRYQEHNLKHPSLFGESHTYKTKQNKLPSFIDRIFFPPTRFNPCTSSKGFGWFTFNYLIRWILLLQSSLFILLWHLST